MPALETLQLGACARTACWAVRVRIQCGVRRARAAILLPASQTSLSPHPVKSARAARNNLSDALAAFTFVSGGFIANGYFNISHNSLNQGTIPAGERAGAAGGGLRDTDASALSLMPAGARRSQPARAALRQLSQLLFIYTACRLVQQEAGPARPVVQPHRVHAAR